MKVLIVDDEKMGRESLKVLLSTCKFEVQIASDGPQALDSAKSFHPEVVIIDWMLGHPMDGLSLADAFREILPSVRIVIISGCADIKRTTSQDAAYDFLEKPFQFPELIACCITQRKALMLLNEARATRHPELAVGRATLKIRLRAHE